MKYEECKTKQEKAKWFLSHKISAQLKTFWDEEAKDFIERWVSTIGGRCVSLNGSEYKFKTREEAIDNGIKYKDMCKTVISN